MKKYFVKLTSGLLHSTIHQVMWYFWVFIVNPFSLLWMIFFSRKLCFLWSLYLFLIDESISLDTSGKPTVGFFLKITSPSSITFSISLVKLNSINDCWRADDEFSWILFYCCKRILIRQKYWRLFGDFIWILFFEYYCEC